MTWFKNSEVFAINTKFLRFLVVLLMAPILSGSGLLAQEILNARLSPTLYFPDTSAEMASRALLDTQISERIQAIKAADDLSLSRELNQTEATYVALRRHGAYLKVQHLENIDDRAATNAASALDTEEAMLDAAIQARLLRVPDSAIASLGRFAHLASIARQEAAHAFNTEVEKYRGSVTQAFEQAVADAYDHSNDSLQKIPDLTAPDTTKRRAALQRREEMYEGAATATASLLSSIIDMENRDAAAQGYPDAADRKYAELGLTPDSVNQVLATIAGHASVNRDYEDVRLQQAKKILGLPSVLESEIDLTAANLPPIPFTDARQLIVDGLKPLGPDYTRRFAALLDPANGRLDLSGGPHRAHTGTSVGVYDAPVALYFSGYNGTLRAAETIAHEGGHAIHRELMNAGGSPIYEREGPHYLFEGFAEFNEMMVLDHIAHTAKDQAVRLRALEMLAAELSHDLFDSAEEAILERNLYKAASGKGLLGREQIDDIYRAVIGPYEIWPISEVGTSRGWMRKSLLFDDPLYMINYLYATVVASALYERAQSDPNFAQKYTGLLRRGFTAAPAELLKSVDINWDDPTLVNHAIRLLQTKTDQLRGAYASYSSRTAAAER